MDKLIGTLREREKELVCLYRVQRLTLTPNIPLETALGKVVEEVAVGWRHPEATGCCIEYFGHRYASPRFNEDAPKLTEPLRMGDQAIGSVTVTDGSIVSADAFLTEERILLETLSWLLSNFVERRHLGIVGERQPSVEGSRWEWRERLLTGIATHFDERRFGPANIYLGGTGQGEEATHGSDVELHIHHQGSEAEKERLKWWLEGWSQSVAESARFQTGEKFPDGAIRTVWIADTASLPAYRKIR